MTIVNPVLTNQGIGVYTPGGNYPVGAGVYEGGSIYVANAQIINAPAAFNPASWTLEVDGVEPFQPNAYYSPGALVLALGQLWSANVGFTSGATFSSAAFTQVSGAAAMGPLRTLSGPGTIGATDPTIRLNVASGAFSQPLPDVTAYKGTLLTIKAVGGVTNLATLTVASGQTVAGLSSLTLGGTLSTALYQSVMLAPDASNLNWEIV